MAHINVSEADFYALARAAREAQRGGDAEQAAVLDKLARKVNAALAAHSPERMTRRRAGLAVAPAIRWEDTPSTLDPFT